MNPEHFHTDIVIPGRALAFEPQAGLGGVGFVCPDEVQHHLLEQGEVLECVILADHAVILTETDIEHPVKPVFNAPVRTNGVRQLRCTERSGTDVVALFQFGDLFANDPLRDDAANRLAAGPQRRVDFRAAGGHPAQRHHDSTVVSIDVLEPVAAGLGIADEIAHPLVQRGLIARHREQIVRPLVDDLGGNVMLAAHGVDADQQALDVQGVEQFRDGRHLIALARDALLPQHQSKLGRKGANHVHRGAATIGRATQALAIDGHDTVERTNDVADPAPEHGLELLRIEHPKHTQEGVLRRNAILEHDEAAQPVGLEPTPQGDVLEAVGVREHGANGNHQDLPEVVTGALLGRRGSSSSLSFSIKLAPVPRISVIQKTRVDAFSRRPTRWLRNLLIVNDFHQRFLVIHAIRVRWHCYLERC